MNLYPIFSRRIAYKLEMMNFELKKIAPNRKHSELKVYYFEDTVQLHNAVNQLIRESKNPDSNKTETIGDDINGQHYTSSESEKDS